MIQCDFKKFDELNVHELYAILQLRDQVFHHEQHCTYIDIDGLDFMAIHLLCRKSNELVGCIRILPGVPSQEPVSLGRVAVIISQRGKGIANQMMVFALDYIKQHYPNRDIEISAQLYLQKFYERFGFVAYGNAYDDEGVIHIMMLYKNSMGIS